VQRLNSSEDDDRGSAQPVIQNWQGLVEYSWVPLTAFDIEEWQESAKRRHSNYPPPPKKITLNLGGGGGR
jgi:hypothetical protein